MLKKKVSSVDSCVTVTCESNNRLLLLFLWAIIRRHLDLAKLFWAEIEVGDLYSNFSVSSKIDISLIM